MKLYYLSLPIAALFLGCTPKMNLIVKSEPQKADIFIVNKELKNQEYIGQTNFKQHHPFTFNTKDEIKTLVAKKYGYKDKIIHIQYNENYNDIVNVKLKKLKKRKMAYAVLGIKNGKIIYNLIYDWSFADTIENSPNALNVERVVVANNLKELIGKFDVSKGKLIYSKYIPKIAINEDKYLKKLYIIINLIKEIEKTSNDNINYLLKEINTNHLKYIDVLGEDFYSVKKYLKQVSENKKVIYSSNIILEKLNQKLNNMKNIPVDAISSELWMANIDNGFGQSKLTNSNKIWSDISPSITSDSKQVYFSSNRNGHTFNIWRLSTDGGMGITKITTSPYSEDLTPSVDSQNNIIAYSSIPEGSNNYQIWTIKTNGSLPSQLRTGKYPHLCENGKSILFNRINSDGKSEIWSMNNNGSGETMISVSSNANEQFADFSPDCKWITYESDESGNKDIYLMKVDGSSKIQLTTNQSVDTSPIWGDDGYIYFKSNRGLLWGIWRLKALIK